MARKAVGTPESVIRFFMSDHPQTVAAFYTAKTILESRGLLTGRKKSEKGKTPAAGFVAGGQV